MYAENRGAILKMRDISLRNLTESRGFEDEKTEDAAHQCSACGMHDDICPSGQCTCSGGVRLKMA